VQQANEEAVRLQQARTLVLQAFTLLSNGLKPAEAASNTTSCEWKKARLAHLYMDCANDKSDSKK
jgi:hypothetical protein